MAAVTHDSHTVLAAGRGTCQLQMLMTRPKLHADPAQAFETGRTHRKLHLRIGPDG